MTRCKQKLSQSCSSVLLFTFQVTDNKSEMQFHTAQKTEILRIPSAAFSLIKI
jgi:hypothetical protein